MKKPVQRLDPAAVFVAALVGTAWVLAVAEAEAVEMGPSAQEEWHVVRAHNRYAQRQIAEAAERNARGEQPKETP